MPWLLRLSPSRRRLGRCSKALRNPECAPVIWFWQVSLGPVLHGKTRYMPELLIVVGDEPHAEAQGMSGDQQIHGADWVAFLFQQGPEAATGRASLCIEVGHLADHFARCFSSSNQFSTKFNCAGVVSSVTTFSIRNRCPSSDTS